MKKVLKFFLSIVICTVISIPLLLLFERVGQRNNIDWLDVFLIMTATSATLFGISKLLQRKNPNKSIREITVFVTTATILFGTFTLFEWIFDTVSDTRFVYDWGQKLTLSISLTIFENLNSWYRRNNLFSSKELVVATACQELSEAEKVCTMLEDKGIRSMIVDKESPMYISNSNNSPFQVQVMGNELDKAKEAIKNI